MPVRHSFLRAENGTHEFSPPETGFSRPQDVSYRGELLCNILLRIPGIRLPFDKEEHDPAEVLRIVRSGHGVSRAQRISVIFK